ncbi:uncharacterized protein G2W53_009025 [Senna tora]|uniref:Uncharacterized protein n=1 Tax=Senna tora TaxID=362788 RepID=A0A835C9K1_9FABA|nr:uncharacterized protein G2W53_009025 [Senna tora]
MGYEKTQIPLTKEAKITYIDLGYDMHTTTRENLKIPSTN